MGFGMAECPCVRVTHYLRRTEDLDTGAENRLLGRIHVLKLTHVASSWRGIKARANDENRIPTRQHLGFANTRPRLNPFECHATGSHVGHFHLDFIMNHHQTSILRGKVGSPGWN